MAAVCCRNLLLQSLRIAAALDQHLPLRNRLAGLQDQLLARDRFDQIADAPRRRTSIAVRVSCDGCDHQHHNIGADGENLVQQLVAGPPGNVMSSENRCTWLRAKIIASRRGVFGLKAFEAVVAEPAGHERSHVAFVVHDQRSFRLGGDRQPPAKQGPATLLLSSSPRAVWGKECPFKI